MCIYGISGRLEPEEGRGLEKTSGSGNLESGNAGKTVTHIHTIKGKLLQYNTYQPHSPSPESPDSSEWAVRCHGDANSPLALPINLLPSPPLQARLPARWLLAGSNQTEQHFGHVGSLYQLGIPTFLVLGATFAYVLYMRRGVCAQAVN